ncbi:MAG: transposase [Leptolyngbyaceae cyanobacterium SU_3_3]|nr:transposase [Leptolyngbyaceae cyanobacterium SU_3_3]NJR51159.1 transposase [Leptolyngbyaceae cyanobacterium CSU_1_3]
MKNPLDYIRIHPQRSESILGISFDDFNRLLKQVRKLHAQEQALAEAQKVRVNAAGAGRPVEMSLEVTVALCLFYLRHDPTFGVLGMVFGVSQGQANQAFHQGLRWLRQVLPASLFEQFGHDPQLWALVQELLHDEVLLADSTEQARERPSDYQTQKQYYSGKKKQHTQKTQVLGTSDGQEIVDVIPAVPGPTSDISLLRRQQQKFDSRQQFMGDKAYQGAERTITPHKKPKRRELSDSQQQENREISAQRIAIEHLIRRLKVFRILTHRFRLESRVYSTVILTICGLVRLRLGNLDFTAYDF